jgi:hypothetical protein
MAAIPEPTVTIGGLIDQYHQDNQEPPRPHMGVSIIGHKCDRYLWLTFRWAVVEKHKGRILRLFRRGQLEESVVVSDLRAIGMDVRETGSGQSRVDFGCHVSGSKDGIIRYGVPGAEKTPHLLEIKTHSDKSFTELAKEGVKKSKPVHWVQMQVYMLGSDLDRALYYAINKDTDEIYTERVELDRDASQSAVDRAKRIVTSDRMPEPMAGASASWYECKYCPAYSFCHHETLSKQVNCRTCSHATAHADSTWHCARHNGEVPVEFQRTGCDSHVLHPDLVPWQRKDGPDEYTAVYEINGTNVANGDPEIEGVFSSRELLANASACADKGWTQLHDMRKQFGGRVVG